jgi:ribonuclease J
MRRKREQVLKVIPLGGLGEIGKNMTVFEYGNDIIVIDCGVAFPESDLPGIDLVIPDFSYLQKNESRIRGIIITHGHEDHIGALPFVLKEINIPVYATRLSKGLINNKLKEHNLANEVVINEIAAADKITLGCFEIEFIETNHSIAGSVALAIKTPVGMVIHTSDFKIDYTPIVGNMIDLPRFAELGKKGVLLLLADSTNVERKGYTMSERTVGKTFEELFKDVGGRIIVATFATNIHRIQQIISAADKYKRKISITGRSMNNVIDVATELGYLSIPEGILYDINKISSLPDEKVMIITTGSQGEPMSALSRMSSNDHKQISIKKGDMVVISATPIPGNEKQVSNIINALMMQGANVIYESLYDVHVSGHACREELKLIHALTKPRFFMPVHGEYKHLKSHAQLANDIGMDMNDIFLMANGQVLEVNKNEARIKGKVNSGRVFVDGLGVGDVGNIVLRDRKHLSEDGLFVVVVTLDLENGKIVSGPDIISRGFIYVKESDVLMEGAKSIVKVVVESIHIDLIKDWGYTKNAIKDALDAYLYEKTQRKPMILPIIIEV